MRGRLPVRGWLRRRVRYADAAQHGHRSHAGRGRLVSGAEDLREAAAHAQGYGISLCLVGMPTSVGQSQSRLQVREADHHLVIPADVLRAHLLPRQAPAGAPGADLSSIVVELARDQRSALDLVTGGLSRSTDKAPVARLSQLTGQHPVDASLPRAPRSLLVERLRRASAADVPSQPGATS